MTLAEAVSRAARRRLADAQRAYRLPSLSAAVARRGLSVLQVGIGVPEPVPETQYRIGSITKTFTAVLVMQLRDEGRLRLDDPLGEHLPGTPHGGLPLRDLLGHVSGLRRELVGEFWEATPGCTSEELLGLLRAEDVLLTDRGWHYSNVAYALLGMMVERLRGMPYAEVLRRRLLGPLGLERTSYAPQAPYAPGLRVHPFADVVAAEPVHDTLAMAPAGQLWSTPGDLCRWGAFLADPPAEVLAPATVEEMCAPVVLTDTETWSEGYGLGLQLLRRGDRVLAGHGGSMPGFICGLAVHRRSGVAAAVCANAWQGVNAVGLACELVEDVLDADPPPDPPWAPAEVPAGLEELLGTWWWRGVQFSAFVTDGALHLAPAADPRGPRAVRYEPLAEDRFVGVTGINRGEHLRVLRDAEGRATHLDIATWIFSRDPDEVRPA